MLIIYKQLFIKNFKTPISIKNILLLKSYNNVSIINIKRLYTKPKNIKQNHTKRDFSNIFFFFNINLDLLKYTTNDYLLNNTFTLSNKFFNKKFNNIKKRTYTKSPNAKKKNSKMFIKYKYTALFNNIKYCTKFNYLNNFFFLKIKKTILNYLNIYINIDNILINMNFKQNIKIINILV